MDRIDVDSTKPQAVRLSIVRKRKHAGARKLRAAAYRPVAGDDCPPLPVRKPGATNPPKPRAAVCSRAAVPALAR